MRLMAKNAHFLFFVACCLLGVTQQFGTHLMSCVCSYRLQCACFGCSALVQEVSVRRLSIKREGGRLKNKVKAEVLYIKQCIH